MATKNPVPDRMDLESTISESLSKAKSITCLMAYAANEGSCDLGEELIWAKQVVDALIDEAQSAADQLASLAAQIQTKEK